MIINFGDKTRMTKKVLWENNIILELSKVDTRFNYFSD